ncbi:Uncharacterized protein ALO94_02000, partial [Pseudomonas syringae pv. spinaceae]
GGTGPPISKRRAEICPRNAKQGRQVEKNRLGNEDGANGLIVQRLPRFKSNWPYYHQRNFLLATSDLDKEILKPLIPELSIKIKGTADRARSHYNNGFPLADREPRSPLDLHEEISPYD